jgi:hypothetical protein
MSLDIGHALRDGASRTAAKNGLILAAVFAGIALLTTVLFQSLSLAIADIALEAFQDISPGEFEGLSQAEYEEAITEAEQFRENLPLAISMSAGLAAGGLLALALLAEAVSIIAVRVFSADTPEDVTSDLLTENILLATLNGFVGKIIVWGLIMLGLVLLVLPGIVLAVLFFFLRQEVAIKNKNFVQAMADSWRLTKGHRIGVFLVGAVLVVVSQVSETLTSTVLTIVSTTAGLVGAAIVGGLLAAFGAAVATRAYVQLDDDAADAVSDDEEPVDPYDAALGPDDLPR